MKELRKTQLAVIKAECIDNIAEHIMRMMKVNDKEIERYEEMSKDDYDSYYAEILLKYKAQNKAYQSIIDGFCK